MTQPLAEIGTVQSKLFIVQVGEHTAYTVLNGLKEVTCDEIQ